MRALGGVALLWASASLLACSGGEVDASPAKAPLIEGTTTLVGATPATHVRMDFTVPGDFYATPFPGDARVRADGAVDVSGFPDPTQNALVERVMGLLDGVHGFGTTSAIFFSLDGPLGNALPDVHASVQPASPIFLIGVDPASPDFGKRYPVSAYFAADGGPFGAPNLLTLLPQQGVPLRAKTTYAAVILRSLGDAQGAPLAPAPALAQLMRGEQPPGMTATASAEYAKVIGALGGLAIDVTQIAGLTSFTTGDPTAPLQAVLADALGRPLPAPLAPFVADEVFDDFCVFHTTLKMPMYQSGVPPYAEDGGAWTFDATGHPVLDHEEEARIVLTIPRAPMPAGGYPTVVLSRTGAGGDRPLVDRGPQGVTGGPPLAPGTGPALHYARAGYAGVSIDGPLGGPLRNPKGQDEQFLIFNVANPAALRDNVRQSAVELALAAHVVPALSVDVSSCPGATATAAFDAKNLVLMGHSMGATISPLAIAFEPRYQAILLSGAGGSWIENVIDKKEPLAVRGIAEVLLGLTQLGYHLHEHDPLLSMFQWAGEGADPPVYGRYLVHEPPAGTPRSVLMMQGIVDHYILPSIANATTLSVGLDLAGGSLDAKTPELVSFTPAASLLDLVGRSSIELPVQGDDGAATAIVVQFPADGIEDGHEVAFQTDAPKKMYRCFLASRLTGVPRVPTKGAATDPCE